MVKKNRFHLIPKRYGRTDGQTDRFAICLLVTYIGYRFVTACSYMRCSVVFGVKSKLLVINVLSSSPTINTAAYYQRCVITCKSVAVVHRRL